MAEDSKSILKVFLAALKNKRSQNKKTFGVVMFVFSDQFSTFHAALALTANRRPPLG